MQKRSAFVKVSLSLILYFVGGVCGGFRCDQGICCESFRLGVLLAGSLQSDPWLFVLGSGRQIPTGSRPRSRGGGPAATCRASCAGWFGSESRSGNVSIGSLFGRAVEDRAWDQAGSVVVQFPSFFFLPSFLPSIPFLRFPVDDHLSIFIHLSLNQSRSFRSLSSIQMFPSDLPLIPPLEKDSNVCEVKFLFGRWWKGVRLKGYLNAPKGERGGWR